MFANKSSPIDVDEAGHLLLLVRLLTCPTQREDLMEMQRCDLMIVQ
jgi:hypothetical protein